MEVESVALTLGLEHLTPMERRLFDVLHEIGRWSTTEHLARAVWPDGTHTPQELRVLIGRTRRQLAGSGWRIALAPGRGAYRLFFDSIEHKKEVTQ